MDEQKNEVQQSVMLATEYIKAFVKIVFEHDNDIGAPIKKGNVFCRDVIDQIDGTLKGRVISKTAFPDAAEQLKYIRPRALRKFWHQKNSDRKLWLEEYKKAQGELILAVKRNSSGELVLDCPAIQKNARPVLVKRPRRALRRALAGIVRVIDDKGSPDVSTWDVTVKGFRGFFSKKDFEKNGRYSDYKGTLVTVAEDGTYLIAQRDNGWILASEKTISFTRYQEILKECRQAGHELTQYLRKKHQTNNWGTDVI